MKLIPQESLAAAILQDEMSPQGIYAVGQTRWGALACVRGGMWERFQVVHMSHDLRVLDRWVYADGQNMFMNATLVCPATHPGRCLLKVGVREEYRIPSPQYPNSSTQITVNHPLWFEIHIGSDGKLSVKMVAEWKDDCVDDIEVREAGGRLHWLAEQKFPPRNADELAGPGKRPGPRQLYACTQGVELPVFERIKTPYVGGHMGPCDVNGLFIAYDSDPISICRLEFATRAISTFAYPVRGMTQGEHMINHLVGDSSGRFHLVWYYTNKKMKREVRDNGNWISSFTEFGVAVKPVRVHEDRELGMIPWTGLEIGPDELLLTWSNGYSSKKFDLKLMRYNLLTGKQEVASILRRIEEFTPNHLFQIGKRVFATGFQANRVALYEWVLEDPEGSGSGGPGSSPSSESHPPSPPSRSGS
jgi:hypothetical protein